MGRALPGGADGRRGARADADLRARTSRSSTCSWPASRAPTLCESIREASPSTRVLLISGAGRMSPAAARAAGASGFVSKDWEARDVARRGADGRAGDDDVRAQGRPAGAAADRARARGAGPDRRRVDQPRDRRAAVPLPAHGQGAHERRCTASSGPATAPRRCSGPSGSGCSPSGTTHRRIQ